MKYQDPFVRQVQIAMITGEPNAFIEWFNNFWNDLSHSIINHDHMIDISHLSTKNDVLYYDSTKKAIFYIDMINHKAKCCYQHYISRVEQEFWISINTIQEITKILLESVLNTEIILPLTVFSKLESVVLNNIE